MAASMSDAEVTALIIVQVISLIIIFGLNTRCIILERRIKRLDYPSNRFKIYATKPITPIGVSTNAIISPDDIPVLSKNKYSIQSAITTANAYTKNFNIFPTMIKKHIKRLFKHQLNAKRTGHR